MEPQLNMPVTINIVEEELKLESKNLIRTHVKTMPMASENINSKFVGNKVCRDNVEVTYQVTDRQAITSTFRALIQAQAIVISTSKDETKLKLKAHNWFSKNSNLQQWKPYLSKPPLAQYILLEIDSEYWADTHDWYLCSTN